ncbi:hypothetical protein EDD27_8228 [Nonomuraea polychroma]|uniref:Uncharacterized protein n=1 Tax=Nonomuraea polychroma TaxID=46176 RepID=A0A438MIZ9_9ACTN|nr:hypothetical protein EDD27_8228 [Nonomuraea polychroma]
MGILLTCEMGGFDGALSVLAERSHPYRGRLGIPAEGPG